MEILKDKLTVVKPSLPDLDEYVSLLRQIWDSRFLTNFGAFHHRFESALCDYLSCSKLSLVCNGSIALQAGLQALRITGEVITTPFTFPATVHAIHWNRCKPVFADIDPETFCISPSSIEACITPETTAILPVHVYGRPCDVEGIQEIADLYGLKVFYDAAHAFGVRLPNGEPILNYGDLSALSFHATKVFNTVEGGALVSGDPVLKKRIDYLINFGIADELTVIGPGSNGKMNELIAAFGLLLLQQIDDLIDARRQIDTRYRNNLSCMKGITVPVLPVGVRHNYGYFPILVDAEYGISRNDLYASLKDYNILARPYFYPLVSDTPCYRHLATASHKHLPTASRIADRVLCLPIYTGLSLEKVDFICEKIEALRRP